MVAPVVATDATASCPAVPARATPRPDRPRYVLHVDVRPAENVVTGSVDVRFTPDIPTDRLVFRLWANGPRPAGAGARLDVPEVRVGAHPATLERPDPTTLVVRLTSPLAAGQEVGASAPFTLTLPKPVDDRISRTGDAVRLGSFFPILAWEPGVGWATEPAVSGFAEASTAPTADFAASVTVPPGFDVLATGVPDGSGRWFAPAVSDFALSVGHFKEVRGKAGPVDVTVGVDQSLTGEDPAAYLARIVASLDDYSARFGPYPWPAFTMAVTPDLRGGIEYPMHVMQGPGSAGRTTPHEVGHQWFFALVENDQGRDPWLDEGLASWAEATHENTLRTFTGRAIPSAGKGKLGQPMTYWEPRQSIYYASVYVQGVQMLAALGPAATVDCILRQYVARTAFRIARPADLLAAARVVVGDKAAAVFSSFGVA
ncbi:MAG TPA: hypothetical protein VFA94_03290 [Acidimicrobiales bacterium]|nr:hypothetical protein [Acidimicrobiales bacterium]